MNRQISPAAGNPAVPAGHHQRADSVAITGRERSLDTDHPAPFTAARTPSAGQIQPPTPALQPVGRGAPGTGRRCPAAPTGVLKQADSARHQRPHNTASTPAAGTRPTKFKQAVPAPNGAPDSSDRCPGAATCGPSSEQIQGASPALKAAPQRRRRPFDRPCRTPAASRLDRHLRSQSGAFDTAAGCHGDQIQPPSPAPKAPSKPSVGATR